MGDMNEDRVIQKLNEHDRRFDKLESEIGDFKHQVLATQDEILTIIRRLDEERVFTTRWIERIEEEITKIKSHLNIK
ncbi:MAG: hypothetical protein UY26_C0003G0313 [Candidatus Jorgensenbacteria bacterium GW2011_GWA1_48_13]|uniref:Uncharacterized protein n=1 Tax=Candidatus Jorgensenbacteria bacterium GW2011_GWB1_50_10 TaxID=1618665 RepID=A0A0G1Z791_9BACT|nr:MAG: hypothetical protein UY26_C0003G0313 [Candidatus Jorgensenbacteria bacterium GW2011_GWA1_48_13]KKW14799.1 MAG: hypothetical protein UY55_C0003G0015 [Candidatus Jorgensenbacteria bacterium GW2011_GWB1_50_10]